MLIAELIVLYLGFLIMSESRHVDSNSCFTFISVAVGLSFNPSFPFNPGATTFGSVWRGALLNLLAGAYLQVVELGSGFIVEEEGRHASRQSSEFCFICLLAELEEEEEAKDDKFIAASDSVYCNTSSSFIYCWARRVALLA